jgi:hypothetical protein
MKTEARSTHYRVPKDINTVIVTEASKLRRNPSEIHRYLLRLAMRNFTPLPPDLVLP